MIGVCTDSNAQLPAAIARDLGIEVVPLSVTIDGADYLEGVDLDSDAFYAHFEGGAHPTVTTAAPSPGRFLVAYEALATRGTSEIVSVHIGSAVSSACDAARVAARLSPVPVHVVDTGAASFVIACATMEAAGALAAGAAIDVAIARALDVARAAGNVFVVGGLDLARRGGRLAGDVVAPPARVPVLSLRDGTMRPIGDAASIDEAVQLMAGELTRGARRLRVAVGTSDPSSFPIGDALEAAILTADGVADVLRYRVGPSVGVHTGPGTAGAVYYELPD